MKNNIENAYISILSESKENKKTASDYIQEAASVTLDTDYENTPVIKDLIENHDKASLISIIAELAKKLVASN